MLSFLASDLLTRFHIDFISLTKDLLMARRLSHKWMPKHVRSCTGHWLRILSKVRSTTLMSKRLGMSTFANSLEVFGISTVISVDKKGIMPLQ